MGLSAIFFCLGVFASIGGWIVVWVLKTFLARWGWGRGRGFRIFGFMYFSRVRNVLVGLEGGRRVR